MTTQFLTSGNKKQVHYSNFSSSKRTQWGNFRRFGY